MTLSKTACCELLAAGFPQPEYAPGQLWYIADNVDAKNYGYCHRLKVKTVVPLSFVLDSQDLPVPFPKEDVRMIYVPNETEYQAFMQNSLNQ